MSHVLVVDDEPSICWGFREMLADGGHEVSIASSAEEALTIVAQRRPDAVVLDVRLPGMDGLTALAQLHERMGRDVPVIVITAFGNLDTAVRALQAGAYDYLVKPFDLDQAARVLEQALSRRPAGSTLVSESVHVHSDGLVGASAVMQRVFKQIALVAATDAPVLITGESGTGKEEVAHAIHRHSGRKAGAFVPVCMGALSANVIESELFGHVKGAFTGADTDRSGLLELAHGGTVFLDEIGDVPLPMQVKLLRAIERHEVTPVGDPRPRSSDFRVIAATNRSLAALAAAGEFREDLLYRLSVFHLELPPLRERRDDIPLLARHFLQRACSASSPKTITADTLRELCNRDWNGNVRELRNTVEHAAIVARGSEILPEHLPAPLATRSSSGPQGLETRLRQEIIEWVRMRLQAPSENLETTGLHEQLLHVIEPPLLEAALAACHQNRAQAAKLLGIHRSTLRQKLRDLGHTADSD